MHVLSGETLMQAQLLVEAGTRELAGVCSYRCALS
jgi:hypothetical protein